MATARALAGPWGLLFCEMAFIAAVLGWSILLPWLSMRLSFASVIQSIVSNQTLSVVISIYTLHQVFLFSCNWILLELLIIRYVKPRLRRANMTVSPRLADRTFRDWLIRSIRRELLFTSGLLVTALMYIWLICDIGARLG